MSQPQKRLPTNKKIAECLKTFADIIKKEGSSYYTYEAIKLLNKAAAANTKERKKK